MYHPSTRLLTILELLQARGRMSGPELARRLEVSPRSVRRYVAQLQDMGIPVEAARGRYGEYRLRPGYKLPPLMFGDDEALAITLGLLLVRRIGALVEGATVEGALAKLDRVLPESVRSQVTAVQETLQIDLQAFHASPVSHTLGLLSRAVQHRRQVHLHYRSHAEASERDLEPYGIVHRSGLWYVVGYCHLRHGVRVFRLDRIVKMIPTDTPFVPPEDFDALAYVNRSIAHIPSQWSVEVTLETTLEQARTLIPPAMATLEQANEGVLLRCTTNNLPWIARQLAALPCGWQVHGPDELREALEQLAHEVLRRVDHAPSVEKPHKMQD